MALEKGEGHDFAKALADLAGHYSLPDMDPKTAALLVVGFHGAMVLGPRAWLLMEKARARRQANAKNVTVAPPPPPPPSPDVHTGRPAPSPTPAPTFAAPAFVNLAG